MPSHLDEFNPGTIDRLILMLRHRMWKFRGRFSPGEVPASEDRQIYWHYTTGKAIRSIMADRLIKPSTPRPRRGERPAVWFTSRRSFSPVAHKGIRGPDGFVRTLSLVEMIQLLGPLARIGVRRPAVPFDWIGFAREGQVSREWVEALECAALHMGDDPRDWRLSFDAVPFEHWVAVHLWVNDSWYDPSSNAPSERAKWARFEASTPSLPTS